MKKFLPEFAAPAAWLVVASGYVKAPVLFAGALHLYQKANDLKSLVKLPGLMMSLKPRAFELIMPIAAFWGLLVLLAPLYGFVLFTGSIVLTLYLTQFFALPVQEDIQHG